MIFVTLGTQNERFDRLLWEVDNINTNEKIIVQSKKSYPFSNPHIQQVHLLTRKQFQQTVAKSDLIITHAGVGSILSAVKLGKKIIACPRLSKYKEHVNNHQLEITRYFTNKNYILPLYEGDNLNEIILLAKKTKFAKYKSNSNFFLAKLKRDIDDEK